MLEEVRKPTETRVASNVKKEARASEKTQTEPQTKHAKQSNGSSVVDEFAAQHLLERFDDVVNSSLESVAFENVDADWMRLNELKFLLYK